MLFEDIVLFVDETVGITNANDNNRRSYGNYLSFHKQSALVKLENEWRVVNTNLKKLQEKVSRLTSEDWGNLEKLSDLLLETQDFSYELRQLLQLFETVLTNSRVGGGLTDTVLSSLKGENSTYRNSLETNIESLTTESQSITDFLLEAPQDVLDKELAVLSAQNRLAEAQQKLEELQASVEVQGIGTQSKREDSEKSVKSAKNSLQNVKEKNALQIQTAETQVDSARNQLLRGDLSL